VKLVAIDHVQLGMPAGGEDVARGFYGGVLGLVEIAKPAQLAGRGGVWFATGGVAVHLSVDPDFLPATRAHPAFIVTDLPRWRARLREAGVDVVDDDSGLPVDRCYVRDPFGNRIELVASADAGFSLR
jgi:catechol 2,3-dioxygenase-like lactoylglutathione lyase family enzyme